MTIFCNSRCSIVILKVARYYMEKTKHSNGIAACIQACTDMCLGKISFVAGNIVNKSY